MRTAALLCLGVALWIGSAIAQSITTGAIQGVITDPETDEPLPGVTVTIGSQTAITDTDGSYKITQLLPGTYTVELVFETATVVRTGVVVGANEVVSVNQTMKIGEAVHVEGTPPPIKVTLPPPLLRYWSAKVGSTARLGER